MLGSTFFAHAQYMMEEQEPNFNTFSKTTYSDPEETAEHNSDKAIAHKEYGTLPFNAPCESCVEVLDKRTEDTRYFIENGSEGKQFHTQQAYGPLHYKGQDGNWYTLDYRLKPTSFQDVFEAKDQLFPVNIDVGLQKVEVINEGKSLAFQSWTMALANSGETSTTYLANTETYTSGDDGVKIINTFPHSIDREIRNLSGGFQISYNLNEPVDLGENDELLFEEGIIIPQGFHFDYGDAIVLDNGDVLGTISIKDASGKEYFSIREALGFDASAERSLHLINLAYRIKDNQLKIVVPKSWLDNPDLVYPLTVDPTVTATNNLPTASITGSGYDPSCWVGYCQYNLSVAVPPNCVVTNITTSFTYAAIPPCVTNQGALDFYYGACRSPDQTGFFWTCSNPGTNSGNCNGSNLGLFSDFQSCIPAPQCPSYDMDFIMRFYRCSGVAGCNNTCIGAVTPWSITVSGRTVENTSISFNQTMCEGNNVTLNATANYGVGPYSFLWSPGGANTSSITVSPSNTTTYSVNITDACNQSVNGSTTVTVIQNTNPGFTISPNPACAGETVTITGNGSNPVSNYDWDLPGSNQPTVLNTNPVSATYANTGNYNVTLNYQNGICVFPSSQSVDITTAITPSVSIAANPSGAICAGTSVTFTATPTDGGTAPTYQWQVNGNNVGSGGATYTSTTLAQGDVVTVDMTSNASCVNPATVTSNQITMTVDPAAAPSVSVAAVPNGPICTGTSVTFTATPTNGGTAPTYQWQVNGNNVGSGGATYTSTTLAQGDIVTVVMTSNANCVNPTTATSPPINMTVNSSVTPSVTIADNPTGSVCTGTNITFTATPASGGSSPTYQWQVNNSNVGTGDTYSSSSLSNGDVVQVIMTSSDACANPTNATSNQITVAINTSVTPTVSIAANPGNTICSATSVTFTATPVSGGTTPSYQWLLNGNNVGTDSDTYTNTNLNDGDIISVVLTSSDPCASPTTATSNQITMAVGTVATPSVTISENPTSPICAGTSVTFTATPINGGSAPSYQWQVNGNNVGSDSPTYTTTNLANGDAVTVVLTSNAVCANPTTATSNTVNMTVDQAVAPSVTITENPTGAICSGTQVDFTATPTNGGANPTYQWQVNGNNAGTGATFSSTTLANGDVVTVILTSSSTCANPPNATSNGITMTVNASVVPDVTISASPNTPICPGDQIDFTAIANGGGNNPTFQWMVNGGNVSNGGTTFSSTTLNDGDVVTVELTSDEACANPTTATSNQVTVTVGSLQSPTVTVSANPNGPVCQGEQVDFTATPANAGSTPSYQWQVNGNNVGADSDTYSSNNLANGDVVTVIVTSSASCANPNTATSTPINMVVNPSVVPSVSATANPNTPVCAGTQIDFSLTPTNEGNNPTYEWQVNGVPSGTGTTFSSTTLNNNDQVVVVLTSDANCAVPTTASSIPIMVSINPSFNPSVQITANPGNSICAGDQVDFTAIPTDAGTNPDYQWLVNGSNVGTNSDSFSSTTLVDGDAVSVTLTSNEACANPTSATSNTINITVGDATPPSVSIAADPSGPLCSGTSVTFTATAAGGGNTPVYQWLVNGVVVTGIDGPTYTSNTLADGDVVSTVLNSNNTCATPNVDSSNAITIVGLLPISVTTAGDTTLCVGEPVQISANATGGDGNYTYTWSNGAGTGSTITVDPDSSTTFSVVVTDNCGSTPATGSVNIIIAGTPQASFQARPPVTDILEPTIAFINTSNNPVVNWDFGDGETSTDDSPEHTYQDTGTYNVQLVVSSGLGCVDTISFDVIVNDIFAFYIPNAFTPGDDTRNDYFFVKGLNKYPYEMHIFNRWGQKVYETFASEPWNGKPYNEGDFVPQGVYSYYIRFDKRDYKFKPITGIVHVIY